MALFNQTEIEAALRVFHPPGNVFEIRVLNAATASDRREQTYSGYFDDPAKAAAAFAGIGFTKFGGAYWTLNPVNPALLSRATNKLRPTGKNPTTGDVDIETRQWFLIDCDIQKPTGIAASDAEHELARQRMQSVDEWFMVRGWPAPIYAESGNGFHLLYRIDQPADDGGLLKSVLEAVAQVHDDDAVKIDTTVHNPSRISRLYGTMNCKGDPDGGTLNPPRPWRMARLLPRDSEASESDIVTREQLEQLAAELPKPAAANSTAASQSSAASRGFDLDTLLANAPFEIHGPAPYQGGRKYIIPVCPWEPDHSAGSAWIIERPDGTIQAGCLGERCKDRHWHDLRDILDPGWRDRKAEREQRREQRPWDTKTNPEKANPKPPKRPSIPAIPPWKPFPTDALPELLANYVREVAASMQCDESMVAIPLLIVMAAAIGATRRLRLSPTWSVPSILWACIVAVSGSKKSVPLARCKKLLSDLEQTARLEHQERMAEYERDKQIYEADFQRWKQKGRDKGEPAPESPVVPIRLRYLFDNVTLEALGKLLNQNPRGLAGIIDELAAWLGSFNAYKNGKSDVSRWLELYNGNSTIIDRSAADKPTLDIPRSAVNLYGGIPPATLQRALGNENFDNGLAARLLMFNPPAITPKWRENEPPLKYEQRIQWRVAKLVILDFDADGNGNPVPHELTLADDAKAEWRVYFDAHNELQSNLTGAIRAAWSKLEETTARIALVLQLAASPEAEIVERDVLVNAIRITDWFKHEAERVYAEISLTAQQRDTQRTIELIQRRGGRARVRDLQNWDRRFKKSAADAEAELQYLVDAGRGYWEPIPAGDKGGRATREFVLADSPNIDDEP